MNYIFIGRRGVTLSAKLWALKVKTLLTLGLIAFCSADSFAQRIRLNAKNLEVETILQRIEQQSGYSFIYDSGILSEGQALSLNLDDDAIEAVVEKLAHKLQVDYAIVNKTVTLTRSLQDEIPISGTVRLDDGKGEAPYTIAGVTVQVKGSSQGIATDQNGTFRMNVPKESTIIFSFLGYGTKEMAASALQNNATVTLEASMGYLDEVVATGYQRFSKRELASSIYSVKAEDVLVPGSMSIDQMLQGKIPGMTVQLSSGEPSAAAKIRIRGTSTINGNKAPIWVIDGVIQEDAIPFNASDVNSPDAPYLIGSSVAGLNPQDILSIDVLKDASATAIYGVKAANGVIVITTKSGKVGPPRVNFNAGVNINQRPSYSHLNLMNSQERIQLSKEITDAGLRYRRSPKNLGYEGLLMQLYNKEIDNATFIQKSKELETMNTDWYDLLFRNSASQDYSLNISGANEKTNYYVSLGYNDSQGSAVGSSSERLTGMLKLSTQLSDKLRIGFKFSGSKSSNVGFYRINPNDYAYHTARTIAPYDASDDPLFYNRGTTGRVISFNVLNEMQETGSTGDVNGLGLQTDIDWDINDFLSFNSLVSYNVSSAKTRSYATERSYYIGDIRGYDVGAVEPLSKDETDSKLPFGGEYSYGDNNASDLTFRNTLDFNKTFNDKHNVNVFAGQEIRVNTDKGYSALVYGYDNEGGERITAPNLTARYLEDLYDATIPVLGEKEARFTSWFMTGAYTYDSRYIINGNIRWDGSNKLGRNPKYRYLPVWSLAGKWIISNEEFLQDNPVFSFLALRGSYGVQGNIHDDSSPSLIVRYAGRDEVSTLKYSNVYRLPNPDLRWEKTKSVDLALEFGLLKGRISGTVEYYNKRGTDLIINKKVSQATGRSYVNINAGVMENKGIEGALSMDLIQSKNWGWNVTVNAAKNTNTIIESQIPEGDNEQLVDDMLKGNITTAGTSVGTFYSYEMTGLSPVNGYPLFMNKAGESIFGIDNTTGRLIPTGNFNPDVVGGFDSRVSYKGFQATIGLAFSLGGSARLPELYEETTSVFNPAENVTRALQNRWKQPGDEQFTNIPALYDDRNVGDSYSFQKYYDLSNIRVAKTDFLRLRNLSLAYNVPEQWLKRYKVQGLLLRLQANNLHTWSDKAWHNLDPESTTANIPILPSYSFSVNLTF